MSIADERERARMRIVEFYGTLIESAASFRSEADQDAAMATYLAQLPYHPQAGLRIAGNLLHQHCRLMRDKRWVELATVHYAACPEGAWGLLTSAALYNTHLFEPGALAWLHDHGRDDAYGYCVCMLRLGLAWPERAAELRACVEREFARAPAEALRAVDAVARWSPGILDQAMIALVLSRFDEASEHAWSLAVLAARRHPGLFDGRALDRLCATAPERAALPLKVIWELREGPSGEERAGELMQRYIACVERAPNEGINTAHYQFQGERVELITPQFVATLCALMVHNPYPAYTMLRRVCKACPHLITAEVIAAALAAIPHATNYAFGFFCEAIKIGEEMTRSCTLALFECLQQEPINRAHVREEQIDALQVTFERSDLKSTLDELLADPPHFGSRRARVLMALMFRSRQRARRRVLLEALRFAATFIVTIRDPVTDERERVDPVWQALAFIIDHGPADSISSEAPSAFLESSYQLHCLLASEQTPSNFFTRVVLSGIGAESFGPGLEFLDRDAELSLLHARVRAIAKRFAIEVKLPALEAYLGRQEADRRECEALERISAAASADKRERMRKRLETLRRNLALREAHPHAGDQDGQDPAGDGDAAEAARLLAHERKALRKHAATQLAAEAVRIMVGSLERAKHEFYRAKIVALLGRELPAEDLDQRVLPAFLWLTAVERHPKTRAALVRLIEDRLQRRDHPWLRSCPEAARWAARVRERLPAAELGRWRSPYERSIEYQPGLGAEERAARVAADLAQTRALLERAGGEPLAGATLEHLAGAYEALRARQQQPAEEGAAPIDPELLAEAKTNLQRVRMAESAPLSDFSGKLTFRVESDPIEILYMGEYGFASCLALRGSNSYSAVANAIDIDKTVIWVLDGHGNVIARRLIALTCEGMLTYHVYTNRPGMHLDRLMDVFTAEYAEHCQVPIIHQGRPEPLLSDTWYDDGPV